MNIWPSTVCRHLDMDHRVRQEVREQRRTSFQCTPKTPSHERQQGKHTLLKCLPCHGDTKRDHLGRRKHPGWRQMISEDTSVIESRPRMLSFRIFCSLQLYNLYAVSKRTNTIQNNKFHLNFKECKTWGITNTTWTNAAYFINLRLKVS